MTRDLRTYWNSDLNAPIILNDSLNEERLYDNVKYLAPDLRPVFLEEIHLLKLLNPDIDENIYNKSVWASSNSYFVNGSK
jgi:hypothetical protein